LTRLLVSVVVPALFSDQDGHCWSEALLAFRPHHLNHGVRERLIQPTWYNDTYT
jgi:hypothetical protein